MSSLQKLPLSQGGASEIDAAKREVKVQILKAKQKYKTKVERKLAERNLASAWTGMKAFAGILQSKNRINNTMDGIWSNSRIVNALNK